ncbi:MAG: alpha/beta fold hydrolase [Hyphomicrobiaceae bacterium]|nr:alpha/beta fold hydrolase [Hyphomicrobiaceae bacterium]
MQAQINGMSMHIKVDGAADAPPIVLHHPLAANLSIWDEIATMLATDFRVVRFDARGHGNSEATKAPYDFATLSRDVVALLDHLGIAKAHFLGLSMGGMVGQFLGLEHAGRFRTLMLTATTSRVPPEGRVLWQDRVKTAREQGMAAMPAPSLQRWLTERNRQNAALVARMTAMITATPVEGYAGWCQAIERLDVTDRLPAIALPTLVVVGAEDPGTPPAAAEVIHRQIPGSELVIMPACAHMLCVEDPVAMHGHLTAFLAKHPL